MLRIIPLFIFVLTLVYAFLAPSPMEELEDITVSREHLYFQNMDKERAINNEIIPLDTSEEIVVKNRERRNIQQLAILQYN